MIIAFGVAWRVNAAAAAVVKAPRNYMTPATFDSLGRYLRPVMVTAGRRTREPVELFAREDYYAQPDVGAGFGGDVRSVAPAAPRWVVSAIMITDEQRMAIVNNVVVQEGSSLSGGARVIEIQSDRVVLQEAGGKRSMVPLNR